VSAGAFDFLSRSGADEARVLESLCGSGTTLTCLYRTKEHVREGYPEQRAAEGFAGGIALGDCGD
jgi:hypothetical protein